MGDVRARHLKLFLECVDADPAKSALRAAFDPADVRVVKEAAPLDWLPVGINTRLTEIVYATLARADQERFFLRLGLLDLESTMLQSLATTALRLFGFDIGRALQWIPRGWTQIYRDQTVITIEPTSQPNSRRGTWTQVPVECAESKNWPDAVAISTGAIFAKAGRTGTASVVSRDASARSFVLMYRWT